MTTIIAPALVTLIYFLLTVICHGRDQNVIGKHGAAMHHTSVDVHCVPENISTNGLSARSAPGGGPNVNSY